MRIGLAGELAIVVVAFVWGASFLAVKVALVELSPYAILLGRFALATAVLLALYGRRVRRLPAATWRAGLAVGACLYGAFLFQTLGLEHTTPARSGFISGAYLVIVPVLQRALFGTRVSPRVALGIAIAFAGMALLTHPGSLGEVNRGDVLTLVCAVGFALHIVVLGHFAPRLPTPDLALLQIGFAGVLALPGALAAGDGVSALEVSAPVLGAVAFLGIFCSALAFGVQTWAQARTTPARAALLLALESVFAALLSVAVGVETLSLGEWAGGLLVVGGVLLGELPAARREPVEGPGASGSPEGPRGGPGPDMASARVGAADRRNRH